MERPASKTSTTAERWVLVALVLGMIVVAVVFIRDSDIPYLLKLAVGIGMVGIYYCAHTRLLGKPPLF